MNVAALLVAWGVFVRLNRSAEELEPEAMANRAFHRPRSLAGSPCVVAAPEAPHRIEAAPQDR